MMTSNHALSTESEIVNRLKAFFGAMGRWEAECKASYRRVKRGEAEHETVKSDLIAALRQLFQEFCTTWEQPARARYGLQFSMIPTYGAELEDVLSVAVSGPRAKVVTQQQVGAKDRLVYRLTYDGRQWRIDDSRKRISKDGTEVDWDL
jgi:hypothetical protein